MAIGPETRYRIERPLARGDRSTVYLAHDRLLERRVALKVLLAPTKDPDVRERFFCQARDAAGLTHAGIVAILDAGERDGDLFVAMEYVEGLTLAETLKQREVPIARSAQWMEELASALACAHGAGAVHRRVNPANLMIDRNGALKVLNFAAASFSSETTLPEGLLPAWFNYLAPEQVRGETTGPESDTFAFGAVCYEVFSGRQAFAGSSFAVLHHIIAGRVEPLARVRPELDARLVRLVEGCLQGEAARRPKMSTVLADLRRYREETERRGRDDDDTKTIARSPAERTVVTTPDRSMLAMDRALAIKKRLADARRLLAEGQLDEAAAACDIALVLDPDHAAAACLSDEISAARSARASKALEAPVVPKRVDSNVQFSVYRPAVMAPQRWYVMLVFAHLAERRPDGAADEPDPVEEVARQAQRFLGDDAAAFRQLTQDIPVAIPEEGRLRLVPKVEGIEFNPPECSFLWLESIHRADFRMRAQQDMVGRFARGSLAVYLGVLLIAEVAIVVPVEASAPHREPPARSTARPYWRLFASYSHKDEAVVRQFEAYAKGLGDRYMRDVIDLRSGEVWSARLSEMIEAADVFQLFWSSNSIESPFVRREWEHALTVSKPDFIRPLYWESPFPEREGLPPAALKAHHFAFVGPAATVLVREDAPTGFAAPIPEDLQREVAQAHERALHAEREAAERRRLEVQAVQARRAEEERRREEATARARREAEIRTREEVVRREALERETVARQTDSGQYAPEQLQVPAEAADLDITPLPRAPLPTVASKVDRPSASAPAPRSRSWTLGFLTIVGIGLVLLYLRGC